ncbi:MAG: prepilin-type N-terminal cleavage/methylation domain-containing protein [Deltaproteobacteria bacterium]|nr:prepilin-type N-terminal cleavage/methylation domain-containing protein [Deltaproteobacteria bacterium]
MRGFTLLEVLVATAILVVVGAAVYTSYVSNVETIRAGRSSGEIQQHARIVLELMRRDLESAIDRAPSSGTAQKLGMIGGNGTLDGRPADRIDFTTLTHIPARNGDPRTDLCTVGYRVDRADGEGFILYRRDDGVPGEDIVSGGREEEVSDRVTGLDLVYVDSRGRSADEWDSFRQSPGGLPTRIEITLSLQDQEGREHLFRTSVHPELSLRLTGG